MVKANFGEGSDVRKIVPGKGCYSVLEYERDISTDPSAALTAYFSSKMNIKKRQVIAEMKDQAVILQAGAMQMVMGNIDIATNVKGAGDFVGIALIMGFPWH